MLVTASDLKQLKMIYSSKCTKSKPLFIGAFKVSTVPLTWLAKLGSYRNTTDNYSLFLSSIKDQYGENFTIYSKKKCN